MELELVDSVPAEPVAPTPAPEETPSPTPQETAPVAPTETPAPVAEPVQAPATEEPVATEPTPAPLFKLPDGREVDAAGLQREYENLLPEFTRKSQRLAELERGTQPITKEEPAWKDPNYQPKDWAEAIEIAKQEALSELRGEQNAAQAAEADARDRAETQLNAVKSIDPKVDENALFEHAVKYGFNDLTRAHMNMKAISDAAVSAEQRTLKNLQNRAADPVATTPTPAPVANPNEYAPVNPANFRGALDFLDSLKQ